MKLEQVLDGWDGKSAADIAVIFADFEAQPQLGETLVRLLDDPARQRGASWLLKAWFESGRRLDSAQVSRVYAALTGAMDWETRLQLLQSIPYMPIAEADRINVETFLREALTDSNKFVRAWAYNGFYQLAKQFPAYREEVEAFFEMALRDEAASVKARVRNIVREGLDWV